MIHETAIVETVQIGEGTRIWAWTHVSRNATIGCNCSIGERVYIGPGVTIGNNCKIQNHVMLYSGVSVGHRVFIGPGVITTNDAYPDAVGSWEARFAETRIEDDVSLCAGTVVICGNTIGVGSMIGAGSVVTQDIRPNWLAYGNPARHIRPRLPRVVT